MAQLISQINSLVLVVSPPVDQTTGRYRDDLKSIKVWVSDMPSFEPPASGNLVYDGPGLVVTIPDLVAGQIYYVKYALISVIDESVYDVSDVAISGSPRSGLGVEISLSNPVDLVPASFDGAVSSFLGTGTVIEVFEGTEGLVYDAVGTSAGTWSVTAVADPEITLPSGFVEIVEGKAVTKNIAGLSDDKAGIAFTATGKSQDGTSFTRTIVQTFSKVKQGLSGTSGSSAALVYAYKRVATAPMDTPGTVTYTFSSNTITSPDTLDNYWQKTLPSGTDPLYITVATASSVTDTDTIDASEWSSPVLLAQNGADGLNTATVFLYARNNSSVIAPTLSTSGTATYTFSSRALSGTIPSGWTTTIPAASSGTVIWVVQATASSITSTDTIANTEWSVPQVLAQKGDTGIAGITVTLSNESHTLPSTDTGVVLNYTGSGTTIQVYEGATLLSAVSSITGSSQFTIGTPVVVPSGGITVGARSYAGTTATIAVHSAVSTSTDLINITYPISLRRSDGTTATINRIQTLTKAKSSKFAYLSASSQVFVIEKDGDVTPSSITLTATGQNVAGSPVFTVTGGTATLTGTGDARTLAYVDLTTQSATIKLTWDGIEDFVTVSKVREGLDGERGSISISAQPANIPGAGSSVFRYVNRAGNRAPWTSGTGASQPVFNETYAGYVDAYATQQICLEAGTTNSVENLKVGDTVTISNFDIPPLPSLISLANSPTGGFGDNVGSSFDIQEIDGVYVLIATTGPYSNSPTPYQEKVLYSTSSPNATPNNSQSWEICSLDGQPFVSSISNSAYTPMIKLQGAIYRINGFPFTFDTRLAFTTNGSTWKSVFISRNTYGAFEIMGIVPTQSGVLIFGNNSLDRSKVLYTQDFVSYTVVFDEPTSVINLGIGAGGPSTTYGPRSACYVPNTKEVLIGGYDGKILKFTGNAGQSWNVIGQATSKLYSQRVSNIATNGKTIVATSNDNQFRKRNLRISLSYDNGANWVEKTNIDSDFFPMLRQNSYASKLEVVNNQFHIIVGEYPSTGNSSTTTLVNCYSFLSTDGMSWDRGPSLVSNNLGIAPVGSLYGKTEPNTLVYSCEIGTIITSNVKEVFNLSRYGYPEKVAVSGYWDGTQWSVFLNSILDGGNILESTIGHQALANGAVLNSNISPLTLTADKLSPNSIASLSTFLLTGGVAAILTPGTTLTRANSTLLGTFTIVNDSNVAERLLVSAHGRSTASGSFSGQSQAFSVFDTAGTIYYSSGYTRSDEDAKGFGFTTTIPAFSSVTLELRAAKTSSYTLTYNLTVNTVGVNN